MFPPKLLGLVLLVLAVCGLSSLATATGGFTATGTTTAQTTYADPNNVAAGTLHITTVTIHDGSGTVTLREGVDYVVNNQDTSTAKVQFLPSRPAGVEVTIKGTTSDSGNYSWGITFS